jgi:hypothetical protein
MQCARSVVAFTLFAGTLVGDEKKDTSSAVRPLDVELTGPATGKATAPVVIESADDLAKALGDSKAAEAVRKLVNFETEKLLYFAWSGSGKDQITYQVADGKGAPEVAFTYTRGLTRDFRPHRKLFAVPKAATHKVVTAGR